MFKYKNRNIKNTVVLIGWLLAILLLFWFFFFTSFQKFNKNALDINTDKLNQFIGKQHKITPKNVLVSHWLNPDCQCTKFSQKYFNNLFKQLDSSLTSSIETQHLIFVPPNKSSLLKEQLTLNDRIDIVEMSQAEYLASKNFIPATPAVAVNHHNIEPFVYLGPHTNGIFCGSGSDNVSLVLNNLNKGANSQWINDQATGCFCDW